MLGIHLTKSSGWISKHTERFVVPCLFLSQLYAVSSWIITFEVTDLTYVPNVGGNLLSCLLWFHLFKRRKALRKAMSRLYKMKSLFRIDGTKGSWFIQAVLFAFLIPYTLLTVSGVISASQDLDNLPIFTFGYRVESGIIRVLAVLGMVLGFRIPRYYAPLATVAICTALHRHREVLARFRTAMERRLGTGQGLAPSALADVYLDTIAAIHDLTSLLSLPLFLIVGCSFFMMFWLLVFVVNSFASFSVVMKLTVAFLFASNCLMVVSLGIFGSLLSQETRTIQRMARQHINCRHPSSSDAETERILRRIKSAGIVTVTAGGWVTLDKPFILSAFGATLTYGLLIINLEQSYRKP